MKPGRVSRIVKVLTTLQSGEHFTADGLAKILGISRRTVFRDLKDLQRAGVPCHCDKKDRYYTINPEFFLPAPDLTGQEALALLLLIRKARNHIHLPFKNSALRAALKIENNLSDKIKRYCNDAFRSISIKTVPQAEMNLLDNTFAQLQKAVLKKQTVKIRYHLPSEKKTITTNLSPYHLIYNNYMWHVIGKSSFHKGIRTLKLNRIKELNTLDKHFIEGDEFDIQEYLGRAWSMTPEGKLYYVKLRFAPEVALSVAEIQWHDTQRTTFEMDGSVIVEFRVDGLNEITPWVLSYGNQVEVLAPKILRRRIIEIAQKVVKTNQQESLAT